MLLGGGSFWCVCIADGTAIVYIVNLDPQLVEKNSAILDAEPRAHAHTLLDRANRTADALAWTPNLDGTLHCGVNEVEAHILPGSGNAITASFDFVVPSVSATAFASFKSQLAQLLGEQLEQTVSQVSGIGPLPPPPPASRMACYSLHLYSHVLFAGVLMSNQSQTFSETNCTTIWCVPVLQLTRMLPVVQVRFSGTLQTDGQPSSATDVTASIPVTMIEFADGLTIPFAGYSDNIWVANDGLSASDGPYDSNSFTRYEAPLNFWTEPTQVIGEQPPCTDVGGSA